MDVDVAISEVVSNFLIRIINVVSFHFYFNSLHKLHANPILFSQGHCLLSKPFSSFLLLSCSFVRFLVSLFFLYPFTIKTVQHITSTYYPALFSSTRRTYLTTLVLSITHIFDSILFFFHHPLSSRNSHSSFQYEKLLFGFHFNRQPFLSFFCLTHTTTHLLCCFFNFYLGFILGTYSSVFFTIPSFLLLPPSITCSLYHHVPQFYSLALIITKFIACHEDSVFKTFALTFSIFLILFSCVIFFQFQSLFYNFVLILCFQGSFWLTFKTTTSCSSSSEIIMRSLKVV